MNNCNVMRSPRVTDINTSVWFDMVSNQLPCNRIPACTTPIPSLRRCNRFTVPTPCSSRRPANEHVRPSRRSMPAHGDSPMRAQGIAPSDSMPCDSSPISSMRAASYSHALDVPSPPTPISRQCLENSSGIYPNQASYHHK